MARITDITCLFNTPKNVAPGQCDKPLPIPELILMTDKVFTAEEMATLEATLNTAMYATTNRLFPFPTIYDTTDKTEANKTGALGSGPTVILKEGYVGYEFMMAPNPCQQSRLRDFNGRNMKVLIYGNKQLFGYQQTDGTFRGFTPASVYLPVPKFPGVAAPYGTKLEIMFLNNWEFEGIKGYSVDFAIQELVGLTDISLSDAGSVTGPAGTYWLYAKTSCGGNNIYTAYKTALTADDTLWVAKNQAGTVIPHHATTPISGDDTGKYFKLKLDTTHAAYIAATTITFSLVDAPTLKAANALDIDNTTSVTIAKNA